MEMKNVIGALVKAQLKIRPPKKSGTNPMFKNRYATYDDIMEAVRIPLAEEGITPWHGIETIDGRDFSITRLLHISGEYMESKFPMQIEKLTSQGIASANTYAKRQGMCNIIGLPGDDDDDGNASEKKPAKAVDQEAMRQVISMAQKETIEEYVGEDASVTDRILKAYKVKSLADLQTKDFAAVLNGVKKIKEKEAVQA